MNFQTLAPRALAVIAVAALVPALWYVFGRPSPVSAVAAINVVVIAGSLWVAMGPTGTGTAEAAH
ncbi:cytochrome-ba3 oxidase subunit [Halovivax cerinus]|uniref:Cytochrome-ba3 oxidase subunit n=1 Tax=Halovivax cerinus TaxID=1487865 RepID=A0ABD5NQB0_9EURY|nr:cytochrome-ba3 oxidase subunit [Halovivax cerinus]